MRTSIDITGQRFGRLTAIRRAPKSSRGEAMWVCRCECGQEIVVLQHSLRSGNTMSCGCLRREQVAERNRKKAKHGMRGTRLYQTWHNMKDRCYREKCSEYHRYGARGITVCEEWRESFEAFRDWAIANGYRDDLTIERKDNDGPYSPDNCKWTIGKEQANNRRNNHLITYNGETHTMKEWAEIYNVPYALLKNRIRKGIPMERATSNKDLRKSKKQIL